MRATSFINEHTAELILVPELFSVIQPFYPKITPIYYWTRREGGVISRGSFVDQEIKLLVLYARRPKVEFPGSRNIYIKLNQILFDRCLFFHNNGIPVIAGFPLANKLEDICLGVKCLWFNIEPCGHESIVEISIQNDFVFSPFIKLLSAADIANQIEQSRSFDWSTALKIINEARNSETSFMPRYNYMGGDFYKPVYLLVHLNQGHSRLPIL